MTAFWSLMAACAFVSVLLAGWNAGRATAMWFDGLPVTRADRLVAAATFAYAIFAIAWFTFCAYQLAQTA